MNIEDKAPEVRIDTSPTGMSTRWWLFLVILWSVALVYAAPLFLLPARESRISVLLPGVGVDSVSFIETKPMLDWLGRHKRHALEVVRHGKTTKVDWQKGLGSPSDTRRRRTRQFRWNRPCSAKHNCEMTDLTKRCSERFQVSQFSAVP